MSRHDLLVTIDYPDGRTKSVRGDAEAVAASMRNLMFALGSSKGPVSVTITKADILGRMEVTNR